MVRAEEDAVGGVVVQVLPDHDGHRVHAGVHRPHPLQGTVTAAIDVALSYGTFYLVLLNDPSVPQPVVQSRRRPLLGPSPG